MFEAKLTYQIEPFAYCRPEMEWLFEMQDQELNTLTDLPMKLNDELYDNAASNGSLVIITARTSIGVIVGYHWSFLSPHPHHADTIAAFTDTYFLHPYYRKGMLGFNFMKAVKSLLKEKDASMLYIGARIDGENDRTKFFERLGFKPSEMTYCVRL